KPRQVIILDEHGVKKAEAMVDAAAAANGIFLQGSPSRRRLPSVHDHGAGSGDRRHKSPRESCDPAQVLEKVKRGPLERQERPHRSTKPRNRGARFKVIAIAEIGMPVLLEIQLGDKSLYDRHAG